jgi:hypothetical protein
MVQWLAVLNMVMNLGLHKSREIYCFSIITVLRVVSLMHGINIRCGVAALLAEQDPNHRDFLMALLRFPEEIYCAMCSNVTLHLKHGNEKSVMIIFSGNVRRLLCRYDNFFVFVPGLRVQYRVVQKEAYTFNNLFYKYY